MPQKLAVKTGKRRGRSKKGWKIIWQNIDLTTLKKTPR